MITNFIRRFANPALRQENAELRSQIRILELEQEKLLDVIARDRARVAAETAIQNGRRTEAEENPKAASYGY